MLKKKVNLIFATMSFSLFISQLAYAQGPPPASISSKAQPEYVEKEVREVSKRRIPERKEEPEIEVEEVERPRAEGEIEKVFIERIDVSGNTVISDVEIDKITAPFEGKEVTLSDLQTVADNISSLYREKGYITSFAYLPPQKIDTASVRIEIIEGKLNEVRIEGSRYFRESLLMWNFRTEKGDIINYDKILWDLRRINENPDRAVQAVMVPGPEKGTTDVVLKVQDRFPYHAFVSWNHQGTRFIGRHKFALGVQANNMFTLDDTAQGTVQFSRESFAVSVSEQVPISNFGTKLGYDFTKSIVWPKKNLSEFDIVGRSQTMSWYVTQVLPDFIDNLTASTVVGFDYITSQTKLLGNKYSHDDLRIAKVALNAQYDDPWGYDFIYQEFDFGIPHIFGGMGRENLESARRGGAGGQFVKSYTSISRVQNLPKDIMLNTSVQFQLTNNRLTPSQQFYLGGANTVRGYPESEVLVDNAFLANIELHFPTYFTGNVKLPFSDEPLRQRLQFFTFFDLGFGNLEDPVAGEEPWNRLMGYGVGVRFRLHKKIFARVAFGFPVGQGPSDHRDYQVHFTVRTELF